MSADVKDKLRKKMLGLGIAIGVTGVLIVGTGVGIFVAYNNKQGDSVASDDDREDEDEDDIDKKESDDGNAEALDFGRILATADYRVISVQDGVVIAGDSNNRYGAIDYAGKVIVPFEYTAYKMGYGGYSAFSDSPSMNDDDKEWYIFDGEGTVVYENVTDVYFSDYVFCVSNDTSEDYVKGLCYDICDYKGKQLGQFEGVYAVFGTRAYDGDMFLSLMYNRTYDTDAKEICRQQVRDSGKYPEDYFIEIGSIAEIRTAVISRDGSITWRDSEYYYVEDGFESEDDDDEAIGVRTTQVVIPYGPNVNGRYIAQEFEWGNLCSINKDTYKYYMYDGDGTRVLDKNLRGNGLLSDYHLCGREEFYNNGNWVVYSHGVRYELTEVNEDDTRVIAEFDSVSINPGKYLLIQTGGRWSYTDLEGNINEFYDDASDFIDGYAGIIEDGCGYVINDKFEKVYRAGEAMEVLTENDTICFALSNGKLIYWVAE